MPEQTLYERIGGEEAVANLLFAFYNQVLADPELSPFFTDVPVEKLRRMQGAFFAAALDGPAPYPGRPIREIHDGMGIRPRHLRRFLEHLLSTLDDMDLDEDDRYSVYTRIAMRADDITGESSGVDG